MFFSRRVSDSGLRREICACVTGSAPATTTVKTCEAIIYIPCITNKQAGVPKQPRRRGAPGAGRAQTAITVIHESWRVVRTVATAAHWLVRGEAVVVRGSC